MTGGSLAPPLNGSRSPQAEATGKSGDSQTAIADEPPEALCPWDLKVKNSREESNLRGVFILSWVFPSWSLPDSLEEDQRKISLYFYRLKGKKKNILKYAWNILFSLTEDFPCKISFYQSLTHLDLAEPNWPGRREIASSRSH